MVAVLVESQLLIVATCVARTNPPFGMSTPCISNAASMLSVHGAIRPAAAWRTHTLAYNVSHVQASGAAPPLESTSSASKMVRLRVNIGTAFAMRVAACGVVLKEPSAPSARNYVLLLPSSCAAPTWKARRLLPLKSPPESAAKRLIGSRHFRSRMSVRSRVSKQRRSWHSARSPPWGHAM